ncbi:MAG TPA: hypothetical protein VIP11_21435 [Gemmatimonadaceae bacterium]
MSTLYNTTTHPTMNDISVTTGNADGWVLILRDSFISAAAVRQAESRSEHGKRASKAAKNGTRRPKR